MIAAAESPALAAVDVMLRIGWAVTALAWAAHVSGHLTTQKTDAIGICVVVSCASLLTRLAGQLWEIKARSK